MRVLIQNGYILSLDSQDRILERGDVLIDDAQIVQIGCNSDLAKINPDLVLDASNKLVAPGLVNADLHSAEVLSKGLFENQPLELRLDKRVSWGGSGPMAKELVYAAALLAGIQAIKTGVTTIQDHWRFSSSFAKEGLSAVMDAYRLLGIRANLALEIEAGNSSHDLTEAERVMACYQEALEYARNGDNQRQKLTIAFPQQFMLNPKLVEWLAATVERANLAVHFHFNQTKSQLASAQKLFQGQTAIARADQLGLLTPRASIAHAVWITPADVEILAASGVNVIHSPLSDLYAGSGVIPLHRLVDAGVHIGLGTGETCGGNLTLFDALKMTAAIHRIVQPDYHHWVSVEQSLSMATHGGARACQYEGVVGRIAVGCKADIVLYDLKGISFSPLNNPKDQLVCLENGSSVDTVLVDGKVVVQGGRVIQVDEADALKQFTSRYQQWDGRIDRGSLQIESRQSDSYWNCVSEPMQIRRWADNPALASRLKQAFVQKGK